MGSGHVEAVVFQLFSHAECKDAGAVAADKIAPARFQLPPAALQPVSYTHLDVYKRQLESRRWQLEPGRSYFVCRNGSSILAFRMGEQLENSSFNVAAAHTDSPCFRIKENAEIHM